MLVTEKLVYIHIPKTAGHFAKRYIKKFAGPVLYEGEWHGPISRLPKEYSGLPVVSFVRNPWDWYVSWFFHQKDTGFFNPLAGASAEQGYTEFEPAMKFIMKSIKRGSKESKVLGAYIKSDEYKQFIKLKAQNEPGLADLNNTMHKALVRDNIGMLVWRYEFLLGSHSKDVIFGRFENLAEDLLAIFNSLGIELSAEEKQEVLSGGPMNVGQSRFNRSYRVFYNDLLVKQVASRERKIIDQFGYKF